MKKILFLIVLLSIAINLTAQNSHIDSLKKQLDKTQPDSIRFKTLLLLAFYYSDTKQDSFLFYTKQELLLANRINDTRALSFAYTNLGEHDFIAGNYPIALQMLFKSLQLAESVNDTSLVEYALERIANTYKEYDDPDKAKHYYLQIKMIGEKQHNEDFINFSAGNLGYVYCIMNVLDSAMYYEQQAYTYGIKTQSRVIGWTYLFLADIQLKLNNRNLALDYYKLSIENIKKNIRQFKRAK